LAAALAIVALSISATESINGAASPRHDLRYKLSTLLAAPVATTPNLAASDPVLGTALAAIPTPMAQITQLSNEGVAVNIGGTTIPISEIAGKATVFRGEDTGRAAQNAINQQLDESTAVSEVASSNIGLEQSVAVCSLDQLLFNAAVTNGTEVTSAAAQAFAQQMYDNYVNSYNHPSPNGPQLSPPDTDEFFSTTALAQYQFNLTVDQEMTTIAGPIPDPTAEQSPPSSSSPASATTSAASPPTTSAAPNRTPILAIWMQTQLTNQQLSISGVSGEDATNIVSFLPDTI